MKRVGPWTGLLGLFLGITVSCTACGGMTGRARTDASTGRVVTGEAVYKRVCRLCHDAGLTGAPKLGDRDAWRPRIARGMEKLIDRALTGYQGRAGMMPARGGNPTLSDDDVAAAVIFMVDRSK